MQPSMSVQGSPWELGEATEPPSPFPPPLSRGSGVVIESPLLTPLLLCEQVREQMDAHILRKRLQLLWGLPHLIQSSLERSVPYILGFLVCTALQDTTGHQRPLFKTERRLCLERHLREKIIYSKWGFPRRLKKSLCVPFPQAVQKSNSSPDASVAQTAQQEVSPPDTGPSLKPESATVAAPMCPSKDTMLDSGGNLHSMNLQMKLIEEVLHWNPSHPLILEKQQDWPLVPNKGEMAGCCSSHSLAPSQPSQLPQIDQPAFLNESQNAIGAARCSRPDLQGNERERPDQCAACLNQKSPVDRFSSGQAIYWIGKPDQVSRSPLHGSGLSPQGVPKPASSQELQLQSGQDYIPKLTSVHVENRGTGLCSFPKAEALAGSPPPMLLPETVVLEQDQSLALQPVKWLKVEEKNSSLTRLQGKIPPAHQVHLWTPRPNAVRPGVSLDVESVRHQTHSCQANVMSVSLLEGNPGSQGAKAILEGEQRRYFEFHLREKLLNQRWGIPRMVQHSVAKAEMMTAAIK